MRKTIKKTKKKLAQGFSPIYYKGKITPGTKGLGPENEKDIKLKIMPMRKKQLPKVPERSKFKQPNIRNIRHLV